MKITVFVIKKNHHVIILKIIYWLFIAHIVALNISII